ncbi:MAG: ROK family protein [Actinomycetales bacterium]
MKLGIDIGGTKTEAVAVEDGTVVTGLRLPTGFGPEGVIQAAVDSIWELSTRTGLRPGQFESIGVGVPGVVDPRTRLVSHAVNLGVSELDLGGELQRRLGVAVTVENDVNAAALGAYQLMELSGSMAYLNLGTGMAAGLVIDGHLLRGSRGAAGEVGHVPVDPAGEVCSCGQVGCLETMASGSGLGRALAGEDRTPLSDLLASGDSGSALVQQISAQLAHGVAAAARLLILTVDVGTVVIGGGLSRLGDQLLARVRDLLVDWSSQSHFLTGLQLPARIQLLPPDLPAAVVGAALAAAPALAAARTRPQTATPD